ncbi:hypothetical protein CDQ84_12020 [Clostridium thermosuccinogenes]|uniref:HTH araC/xylS-type domain-containing protein n=1 Tax=Clostridium thermosuccinogenes TaxID=84032 RepID=A0A2K2FGZ7_9CLOT|nr:AraC family transcriptional regulator [Pseudoclostridium thermosuccinogenes]AUS96211.1 hypothetical protein CDO33_07025 [Pseudoclostridium thermosuccinogenes]PNT96414.1 hypothetical protein CDQ85_11865 [Pseudoclostridium thermosuccinogenes]PNT98067.1 hypothetical protein CDQ84_12020 [Pseudoclostridium thermosuccinogenes]
MCDMGLNPESFNPRVLYIFKKSFPGDYVINQHSHDFATFIYTLSGSCTYYIENNCYTVKKGDLLVINPGVCHYKVVDKSESVTQFHAGFNNLSIRDLPRDFIISQDASPVVNLSKYEYDFARTCSEILNEQEKNEPGFELFLKSAVMKLIVLILKATNINSFSRRNSQNDSSALGFEPYDKTNVVNTIISYINDRYMEEISLEKISQNTYLSPVYISKIFKDETGDSPINYLIKVRLSKAKELLEEGKVSIKTAAKSVGYHDAYYFSKLFKKYYGYPPSKVSKSA